MTRVAREVCFAAQIPFDNGSDPLLAHILAFSRVFAMSDKMDSDLPMPISSARTPPPVSKGETDDLVFVITWQKLQ